MGMGGQHHAPTALPLERPDTHCTGGWVGPRAGLEGCGKSRPHQDSIPGPSSRWRVAIPTALSRPKLERYTVDIWSVVATKVSICIPTSADRSVSLHRSFDRWLGCRLNRIHPVVTSQKYSKQYSVVSPTQLYFLFKTHVFRSRYRPSSRQKKKLKTL